MALLVLCVMGDRRPSLAVPTAPAPPGPGGRGLRESVREARGGDRTATRASFARSGLALEPGDRGLGCRFRIGGEPRGETVLVEVRLTRPTLVGGGQAVDRWYVPARRGETALAEHRFVAAGEAAPGQWDLALYIDDQLQAERRFEVQGAPSEASPNRGGVRLPSPGPPLRLRHWRPRRSPPLRHP